MSGGHWEFARTLCSPPGIGGIGHWIRNIMFSSSLFPPPRRQGLAWSDLIGNMLAIIYQVCSLPLIAILFAAGHRARKGSSDTQYPLHFRHRAITTVKDLFWQLNVIGLILLTAALAMILIPLTLAGGVMEKWKDARIVAPPVAGFLCIPAFVVWERRAPFLMMPFYLLTGRAVYGALGIGVCAQAGWALQSNFLYTVLVGLMIFIIRRLKPFILTGVFLWLMGYDVVIRYIWGIDHHSRAEIIPGEVLSGLLVDSSHTQHLRLFKQR
jgi:MFS transporter, SIT family, siderophore-iron:H+ symporter